MLCGERDVKLNKQEQQNGRIQPRSYSSAVSRELWKKTTERVKQ